MQKLIKGLSLIGLAAAVSGVWAASIPLYQSPDKQSKVTTQVEAGTRLIPIYRSSQHHGWVKVADPKDGSVGWLRIAQPSVKWVHKSAPSHVKPAPKHADAVPALKLQPAQPQSKSSAPKVVPDMKLQPSAPKVVPDMKLQQASPAKQTAKVEAQSFVQRIVTTDNGAGPKRYQVIEYSGPQKLTDKQIKQVIRRMEQRNIKMQQDMQRMMNEMEQNFFGFQPIAPPAVERIVVVPVQAQAVEEPAKSGSGTSDAEKPAKPSFWQKIKNKVSS